ncbi:hypothetical protein GT037_004942, partial [Alternaria burnsii]
TSPVRCQLLKQPTHPSRCSIASHACVVARESPHFEPCGCLCHGGASPDPTVWDIIGEQKAGRRYK